MCFLKCFPIHRTIEWIGFRENLNLKPCFCYHANMDSNMDSNLIEPIQSLTHHHWLVLWNMTFFFHILGMSSSQLLLTPSFFRGVGRCWNHQADEIWLRTHVWIRFWWPSKLGRLLSLGSMPWSLGSLATGFLLVTRRSGRHGVEGIFSPRVHGAWCMHGICSSTMFYSFVN